MRKLTFINISHLSFLCLCTLRINKTMNITFKIPLWIKVYLGVPRASPPPLHRVTAATSIVSGHNALKVFFSVLAHNSQPH